MGGDVCDDAQPAPHGPVGRRTHSLCATAPVAPTRRSRFLAVGGRARHVVGRVVHLGRARAVVVARPPRTPSGPRRAAAAATVAAYARMGSGVALCRDVRAGAVPPLTREVGGGWWRLVEVGGGWGR